MRNLDEADRAAVALGDAIHLEGMRLEGERPRRLTQYQVRCIFCHKDHASDFWDEIDEGIMRCRDLAPAWKQARLGNASNPIEFVQLPSEWEREAQT